MKHEDVSQINVDIAHFCTRGQQSGSGRLATANKTVADFRWSKAVSEIEQWSCEEQFLVCHD